MSDKTRQALLREAVDQFHELIGRFGQHAVAAGDEVYIQPHVYLSTHLVEMRAAGWTEIDFDEIAAVSGASALFGYQRGSWRPKYAHLSIDPDKRIAEATGFGYEWVEFADAEMAWWMVVENIDSGHPLKGWHWENVLFAGYRDTVAPVDRQVFTMADGPDTYVRWWSWAEFVEWWTLVDGWNARSLGHHTDRVPVTPPRDVALRVLRDLVAWSRDPPTIVREKHPEAIFGLAGIEAYARDCANLDDNDDWLVCHDVNGQWALRNASGVYLRRVVDRELFSSDANQHLLAASSAYRRAYEEWQALYEQLGHNTPEGAGKTRDRRLAGAAAVCRALDHEKAALGELDLALGLLQ